MVYEGLEQGAKIVLTGSLQLPSERHLLREPSGHIMQPIVSLGRLPFLLLLQAPETLLQALRDTNMVQMLAKSQAI